MILCMFSLPYPSHLAFPEETDFYFPTPERPVHVHSIPMKGASLFSYDGENVGWLTKDYPTEIYRLRLPNTEPTKGFRYFYLKTDSTPSTGGILVPLTYTRIQVFFEIEDVKRLEDELQQGNLRQWVESVLNDFIDLYRLVTQEIDITRPRINDIPVVDIFVAKQYKFNDEEVEGGFELFRRILNWQLPSITGFEKDEISATVVGKLSYLLENGFRLRIYERLLLDAKEQWYIRGEHDLAIILIETAFETYLQEDLSTACEVTRRTQLPFGRGKGRLNIDYKEAIEKGSVKENLLEYVEELTGKNIKGGKEFQGWLSNTYEKRNDIIHRGIRNSSRDDVQKAFESAVSFIKFINDNLPL